MKKLFIIANWKSNKTSKETREWFQEFVEQTNEQPSDNAKEVVLCPSSISLPLCQQHIKEHALSLKLGAQNISPFGPGAYTGEVHGSQIQEYGSYVLINHSERQKYFAETNEQQEQKVIQAKTAGLTVIFCTPTREASIPEGVTIVAYEPPTSISPGIPDTPENANIAAQKIKKMSGATYVLYGGNVTQDNVASFTHMSDIDGVLVGRASLSAADFAKIIKNA